MRGAVLAMVAVWLLGCAPPPGGEQVGDGGAWAVTGLASSLEVAVMPAEVRLVLHVTNATDAAVAFTFPTSQRYDFVVEDGSGAVVWRWSDDRAFLQVITEAELGPGETWTMEAVWEPGDRRGAHVALGRLVAMDRPLEQRMTFELP